MISAFSFWGFRKHKLGISYAILKSGHIKKIGECTSNKGLNKLYQKSLSSYLLPFVPNCALKGSDTLFKKIDLPFSIQQAPNKSWLLYAKQSFPQKRGASLDFCKAVLQSEKNHSSIQVFAADSNICKQGLPQRNVPLPVALCCFTLLFSKKASLIIIDISDSLNFCTVQNGLITNCLSLPFSEKDLKEVLEEGRETLPKDLSILITGPLRKKAPKELSTFSLEKTKSLPLEEAASIGAALVDSHPTYKSCYFRQGYTSSYLPLGFIKKPLALLYLLSLIVSLLTLFLTLHIKQETEKSTLASLSELQGFSPLKTPLSLLKGEDLSALVRQAEKERLTLLPFDPFPGLPSAQDILLHLHKESPSGVKLKKFSYKMQRRPSPKRPKDPYEVKVLFSMELSSLKEAEAFHSIFVKQNFLDKLQGDIFWKASAQSYEASFVLKSTARRKG